VTFHSRAAVSAEVKKAASNQVRGKVSSKEEKMEDVGIDPTASRICLFVIGDIVLGYTDSNFPFLRIYLR
jgi:hypothetical protein